MITQISKRLHRFHSQILIAVIFFMSTACAAENPTEPILAPPFPMERAGQVRVAVAKDVPFVKVFIAGSYKIINVITKETLLEGKYLRNVQLTTAPTGFRLGDAQLAAGVIAIESVGGTRIYINDRIFRGGIRVLKSNKGLVAVNTVELEEYLYGVVRNEVSTWWPMEAIKAQVIAARTYVLYQIKESKGKDYDVTADVGSQVYGGIFSEKWRTNRAVDLTRGKVLAYNETIFPAYFHATCGGATSDAANLWNISLPPLKGVKCDWCRKSPHYSWQRRVTLDEAKTKLENAGYAVGDIESFEVIKKDSSGRIIEIEVKGGQDTDDMLGKDFRLIIGADILRSTNFKAAIIDDYIVFEGLGWGHGVGMCQWGAYYMSRAGKKMEEILQFYYPGAKVEDYKDVK